MRLHHFCRDDRNLHFADFSGGLDLTDASFRSSCLDNARLDEANLTNANLQSASLRDANLRGANLTGISFYKTVLAGADLTGAVIDRTQYNGTVGLAKEQLYSTANYQEQDLRGLWMHWTDLSGWDFSGQDLTDANLCAADLTDANLANANLTSTRFFSIECSPWALANADFSGAIVVRANLTRATRAGFTKEQLYSTASWQQKDLREIKLGGNDLAGVDFHEQDLSAASLGGSTLTDANLSGAILANASLGDLAGADLTGANLKNTYLLGSGLETASFDATTIYNQWTKFPDGFDPLAAGLTYQPSPVGDFDPDDVLDATDIDVLTAKAIRSAGWPLVGWFLPDALFDLNSDSIVDLADHRTWIKELKNTWFGDANMDGEFNSNDMVQVFAAGKYEAGWVRWSERHPIIHNGAGWAEGDWNSDGLFDSGDMVTAFVDGGYEKGVRTGAVSVPEPSAWLLSVMGLLPWLSSRRARRPIKRPILTCLPSLLTMWFSVPSATYN
jgi:uncharacterized protein YjbI with pentapeptide repeats